MEVRAGLSREPLLRNLPPLAVAESSGSSICDLIPPGNSNLEKAAAILDQVLVRGRTHLEPLQQEDYRRAKRSYVLYHSLSYPRAITLLVLLMLPFLEAPQWCEGNSLNSCGSHYEYLLSGIHYLPRSVLFVIEMFCLFVLSWSVYLLTSFKYPMFNRNWLSFLKVGLLMAMTINLLVAALPLKKRLFLWPDKMFGGYIRIFVSVTFSRSLRRCFWTTLHSIPYFIHIGVLLLMFVLLSAWFANLLFENKNFQDYPSSLLSLFIMLTTANNPNVWAATFEENFLAFCFFFSYMLVGFFFLMQLMFSLIYRSYKVQLAFHKEKQKAAKEAGLKAAFNLLKHSKHEWIYAPKVHTMFQEMSSYRHMKSIPFNTSQLLGAHQTNDADGILFPEFEELCELFTKEIKQRQKETVWSIVHQQETSSWKSQLFANNSAYGYLSWLATFASPVAALLNMNVRGSSELTFKWTLSLSWKIQCFLGGWFLAECLLKLYVQGLKSYWSERLNIFDFVTSLTVVVLQTSTIWFWPLHNWACVSIIVRSLRSLVFLNYYHRWRVMRNFLVELVSANLPVLGLQYCVCSFFSLLGVQMFGGLVFRGNAMLQGSEYKDSGLWVFNYNEYAVAMVTSFNLCLVNNWYVIMDGYVAATGLALSRAYFIMFWAIGVAFTTNVVVALFVGAVIAEMEKPQRYEEPENPLRTHVTLRGP